MPARPDPFNLVFSPFRNERFPAIRNELGGRRDLASFMLAAPALELMRELRPEDGLGEAVDDFVTLVHAAYLFWVDGERLVTVDEPATRRLCLPADGATEPFSSGIARRDTRYIQIAPRIVWGQLAEGAPFEPLDGAFVGTADADLHVVACFGVHPERPGVSVVAIDGPPPSVTVRPDGTALFAPRMPGGDAAHLHAVITGDELLLLAWRAAVSEETS
jgi:hypothetical protein